MSFSVLGLDEDGNKVEVNQADRRRGMYIIGSTGAGKSTLIENLCVQDIAQGLGVCVVDVHEDLTGHIIARMKKERLQDVVYIELGSHDYVAPFNLFQCDNPDNPFETQNVISAFMHILNSTFNISEMTPRMNQYFINIARLLSYNPDATILEIKRVLTDDAFLQRLLANVTDYDVRWFWEQFYTQYSKGQRRGDDIFDDF